jgi:endogenous inhibitor of DNA gyrase (YacG/DUF329 family)
MERKCPTCRRKLTDDAASSAYRPFCSERCRLADLGSWLDGAYRIGSPVSEEDLDQGLGGQGDGADDADPKRTQ